MQEKDCVLYEIVKGIYDGFRNTNAEDNRLNYLTCLNMILTKLCKISKIENPREFALYTSMNVFYHESDIPIQWIVYINECFYNERYIPTQMD